jgi:hypothetical protein
MTPLGFLIIGRRTTNTTVDENTWYVAGFNRDGVVTTKPPWIPLLRFGEAATIIDGLPHQADLYPSEEEHRVAVVVSAVEANTPQWDAEVSVDAAEYTQLRRIADAQWTLRQLRRKRDDLAEEPKAAIAPGLIQQGRDLDGQILAARRELRTAVDEWAGSR